MAKILDGFSVVICENDGTVRDALNDMVINWGAKTYPAKDSKECLEIFKNNQINVLIVDIHMPYIDGLTMIAKIKNINSKTQIIVIAAPNDIDTMKNIMELDVGKVLFKPVNFMLLKDALLRVFEKVQLEKEIAKERQYYHVLAQSTIFSKSDLEGNITEVNDNLLKISGYTKEELIGRSHNIFRHPDMPKSAFKNLWETITQGKVWSGVVKSLAKDKSTFIVNATIVPLVDENGKIYEYMSIRQDITEQEVLRSKVESERKKAENDRIEKAIDSTRDGFLLIFTHELKTPLNAIINFCEYVRKAIAKSEIVNREKLLGLLEVTRSNAYYMLESIINTLDIAKMKSGKITFNKTTFNLHNLIKQMMSRHESLLNEQFGSATFKGDASCFISADEFRVMQLLSNIYSNAIKYGNGKIAVTLECDGDGSIVHIEDNGTGIAGKPQLFDLFEQGEETDTKRVAKGTGIGLHFVKLLCEGMGIEYRVESSKALGGTDFVLVFKKGV